jgi:Cu/Ag efflux protein CusF
MKIHRPSAWLVALPLMSALLGSAPAFSAEEVSGIVKSVDVEAKKLVVTPTGKESTVDVVVNDKTLMKTESGDAIALKELKAGDGVGIAHKGGLALNILVAVKPSELTGHVKSVGANLKTFVVTETGTTTDVTVAISPETSIVTTDGKKLELKELKKGDGVGIAHTNSLAAKIVVNVKPVEKDAQ